MFRIIQIIYMQHNQKQSLSSQNARTQHTIQLIHTHTLIPTSNINKKKKKTQTLTTKHVYTYTQKQTVVRKVIATLNANGNVILQCATKYANQSVNNQDAPPDAKSQAAVNVQSNVTNHNVKYVAQLNIAKKVHAQNAIQYAKSHNATPNAPTQHQNAKVYAKNHYATGNAIAQQIAKNHVVHQYVKNPHTVNHSHLKQIAAHVQKLKLKQKNQKNAVDVMLKKKHPHQAQQVAQQDVQHTIYNA